MRKLALVTGTTHGIGRVTARELAMADHDVVMLCRDVEAAVRVRNQLAIAAPKAGIHVVHCDLASFASVREAAATVRRDFARLDLLINNAGIAPSRHRMSEDGFELCFATNHLGPFLLTTLLLERMGKAGRIINVASRVHYRGSLNLERIANPAARFIPMAAYAQSKLANVLHTFALARRLEGKGITANCLHPGVVATNLLPRWLRAIRPILRPDLIDEERGAKTTLHLAMSDAVAGVSGKYFDEHQVAKTASPAANGVALQDALWDVSERWTGLRDDARRIPDNVPTAAG